MSIDELVGGATWQMTQPFGRTPFSTGQGATMYAYGTHFGLAWGTHPGIDIGIEIKTPLYSPVDGEVLITGGTTVFTNVVGGTSPQTGQLKIKMDSGNHVILGHMRRIDVQVGQRVTAGQYVGVSGYNNGNHVHVEIRVPDTACDAGFRIVDPIGIILSRASEPKLAALRFFKVASAKLNGLQALPVYDQPRTDAESSGEYGDGDVIPCHNVILAQMVKPEERAWGQISGGTLSGKWAYLGYTTEVRSGGDGVDFYVVTTNVKNIRIAPDSTHPPVGYYTRGAILPISEVIDGEEVDPGQKAWGKFAYGPFEGQWAFLASHSTLRLTS